jgi:hypothetical protein
MRTQCDWGDSTDLEKFLQQRQLTLGQIPPVSREFFIDFVETTAKFQQLSWTPGQVIQMNYEQDIFKCIMDNGDVICAQNILLATGYYDYRFIPTELAAIFPEQRRTHTADCTRCLRKLRSSKAIGSRSDYKQLSSFDNPHKHLFFSKAPGNK